MEAKKPYEIAFCMAGAVSAGAYTAGVMDFFIQALDEWENAKQRNRAQHGENYERWDVPWHDVVIKTMSGASAGGMTAAITAASIGGAIEPIIRPEDEGKRNNLFDAWVSMVDIKPMLGKADLEREGKIISLLDSGLIDDIARQIVEERFGTGTSRPYFDENLQVFLTVTNTRGVPFRLNLGGNSGKGQYVYDHADFLRFEVSANGNQKYPNGIFINMKNLQQTGANLHLLGEGAKATGAFPVGLAARVINRDTRFYEDFNREYRMFEVPPAWGMEDSNRAYSFVATDGGVLNNEPFEIARRSLLPDNDREHGRNPREADKVHRTVIMIDPFPSDQGFKWEYENDRGISKLAGRLISTFRNQAYFDVETLKAAADEGVYSRKLIAPSRTENRQPKTNALACGVFDGFSGFLAREYRQHDFYLGRRNAQQFLRKYFTVPLEDAKRNPILADFANSGAQLEDFFHTESATARHVPVIPLVGRAAEDCYKYEWPFNKYREELLKPKLEERADALLDIVIGDLISDFKPKFMQGAIKSFAKAKARRKIVSKVMETIKKGLHEAELIS